MLFTCTLQELKRIIRELKLNTGQSFWKNHANREDLIDVRKYTPVLPELSAVALHLSLRSASSSLNCASPPLEIPL